MLAARARSLPHLPQPQQGRALPWFFELLHFMAENFVFSYLGLRYGRGERRRRDLGMCRRRQHAPLPGSRRSVFTNPHHEWKWGFIVVAFFIILVARAVAIVPLAFFLNLRKTAAQRSAGAG